MNTPKTDANCGWPWGHHGRIECADLKWSPDGPFVHSEVARHLERENVALRKQLEQWEQSTQWFAEWADKKQELECENAALKSAMYRVRAAIDDPLGSQAERLEKAGAVCDKALGSE